MVIGNGDNLDEQCGTERGPNWTAKQEYSTKLEAWTISKKERVKIASVYDEKFLDSSGVMIQILLDKENAPCSVIYNRKFVIVDCRD